METCARCGEQIAGQPCYIGQSPFHFECGARLVVNGLNHQLKLCRCYGGTEPPDPPEMTKREAAVAAYEHWRKTTWPAANDDAG